jgi:hypothetical protein
MHHFVGADNSCISWGHAQNGELGYGPSGQKYVFLNTQHFFGPSSYHYISLYIYSCISGLRQCPRRWIFWRACMLLGELIIIIVIIIIIIYVHRLTIYASIVPLDLTMKFFAF